MQFGPLIRYLVLMPLKHVVSPRSEVQEGLLNHSHHEPARQDMLKYLQKFQAFEKQKSDNQVPQFDTKPPFHHMDTRLGLVTKNVLFS